MIELTEQQVRELEQAEKPATLLNPKTRETFVLVRKDVFDLMRKWMDPFNKGWDNPALDVYEESPPRSGRWPTNP
jgi:hypothetical protein